MGWLDTAVEFVGGMFSDDFTANSTLGETVTSALGGAVKGAATGAIVSELTGGDWQDGALYGGAGGAALGGASAYYKNTMGGQDAQPSAKQQDPKGSTYKPGNAYAEDLRNESLRSRGLMEDGSAYADSFDDSSDDKLSFMDQIIGRPGSESRAQFTGNAVLGVAGGLMQKSQAEEAAERRREERRWQEEQEERAYQRMLERDDMERAYLTEQGNVAYERGRGKIQKGVTDALRANAAPAMKLTRR